MGVDLSDAFQRLVLSRHFGSWAEFESALSEFQHTTHTHYIHAESKVMKDVKFKYMFVVFQCTFGHKRKPQGLGLKKKPSKFLNCQSTFRVTLELGEYVIKSFKMFHNHPCSDFWMVCDPWTRRISSEDKENMKSVLLQSPVGEVTKSVRERIGKHITPGDGKTIKAQLPIGYGTRIKVCSTLRQDCGPRSSCEQVESHHKYQKVAGNNPRHNKSRKKSGQLLLKNRE